MKNFIRICFVLLIFTSFSAVADAQTTISEEKRKLIGELIVLTKTDQQIVEITDKMLESMEKMYPTIVAQTSQMTESLSAEEKKQLSEMMDARFKSFSRKFREKLPQRINYKQFVIDAIYPLYDKFFTEKELGDLIAFYKTETGQKVTNVMPKLMEESTELSAKFLLPQVIKLVEEIMKEEFPELNKASSGGPPPPAKRPN